MCTPTSRVAGERLFLYTRKTNVPVFCPLPKVVVEALDDMDPVSEEFLFWTGVSDLRSITGNWQRRFQKCLDRIMARSARRFSPGRLEGPRFDSGGATAHCEQPSRERRCRVAVPGA
jgi:hypothetical protein